MTFNQALCKGTLEFLAPQLQDAYRQQREQEAKARAKEMARERAVAQALKKERLRAVQQRGEDIIEQRRRIVPLPLFQLLCVCVLVAFVHVHNCNDWSVQGRVKGFRLYDRAKGCDLYDRALSMTAPLFALVSRFGPLSGPVSTSASLSLSLSLCVCVCMCVCVCACACVCVCTATGLWVQTCSDECL